MSGYRHIDRVCAAVTALAVLFCLLLMARGEDVSRGSGAATDYESRLFDTSRVHSIDIIMEDWEGFLDTAVSEEYSLCSVVIDGERLDGVGIRGKGNTSLSKVEAMDSRRYSLKIEFDHYEAGLSYHGLDKLCLNNLIQDNSCMKDYLCYRMMGDFGVASPLCSYVNITVNGEPWGLYLAVEAVEEAFLRRNYGSGSGELYKPDSMDMGGGRGNGRNFGGDEIPAEREAPSGFGEAFPGREGEERPEMPGGDGFGGGGGSAVTKLQYLGEDVSQYAEIFDSAKTDITEEDRERLIASLKQLSEYRELEEVLFTEELLRYFVVHSFVVNGDSYTGDMIHNYYLYEERGRLAMIPWDYNLAFGAFEGGSAEEAVNADIDAQLTDRPMQAWIFADEAYAERYYELYGQFLEQTDIQGIIDGAYELIAPYVEADPTAFCSYEEFEAGGAALKEFCALRAESAALQLGGSGERVDCGELRLSDMGSMGGMGEVGEKARADFGGDFGGEARPPEIGAEPGAAGPAAVLPGEGGGGELAAVGVSAAALALAIGAVFLYKRR